MFLLRDSKDLFKFLLICGPPLSSHQRIKVETVRCKNYEEISYLRAKC